MKNAAGRFTEVRLALKLMSRELRSGELTLIFLALVLAVTVTTAIALFSQRLDLAMQASANDMLGADLRVRSTTPLEDEWLAEADSLGLDRARALTFPSVVVAGDQMTLSAVKAVDDGYPLRGELLVLGVDDEVASLRQSGPEPGEAWVEARLLSLLNIGLGDEADLGGKTYRITGLIEKESDRGGNFYTLSPRIMVHWSELESSPMLGPGSRVRYRLMLSGDDGLLEQFQNSVELKANQSFEALGDGNRQMAASLDRARRYLGLAAILAVVLACVAVAVSARRYAERHFDISALMRTFGLPRASVLRIFLAQLLLLGGAATLLGALFAYLLQLGLLQVLSGLIPEGLPSATPSAWALGLSAGLLGLFGFGVPHLLPLSSISPLRVLRRDLVPVPLKGWFIYAVALGSLTLLLSLLTQDIMLSGGLMVGGAATLLLLLLLLRGGLRFAGSLLRNRKLPLSLRFAWQHLSRSHTATAGQLLAFAMTLMVMLIIGMLRTDLLADWQRSMPQDAPNIFALNIQPFERESFSESLVNHSIETQALYPMIPMRLVKVNGMAVSEMDIAEDRSINRDLITSSAETLPDNNEVVGGDWSQTAAGPGQVSVEHELAERLGLGLGDVLTFRAAGVDLDAEITSLRRLDWTAMTPNFFMMLSPDLTAELPMGYMTSFHLADEHEGALVSLIRKYPGITFIDTRAILSQVQTLLQRLTTAVELILVFVLLGAVLVMLSVLLTSTRERLTEGAVLRTLGAARKQLRQAQWVEFALLGVLSAVLALVGAELVTAGLYIGLLDIPYSSLGWAWLWLPPATALGLAIPGSLMLRRVSRVPPLTVLREG